MVSKDYIQKMKMMTKIDELEAQLRACKRENRRMWEKLRISCRNFRTGCGEYCFQNRENCAQRNCPLLIKKGGAK